MNSKWYTSAAVSGSGFENLADRTVEYDNITTELLKEIDLLFVKDLGTFMTGHRGFFFTIVTEKAVPVNEQERFILEHPGNFFLSRIGHDIVNLISPLEHYEYIEHDLITDRVRTGNHFGKQINFIGHLLQSTVKTNRNPVKTEELTEFIKSLCRKTAIDVSIDISGQLEISQERNLINHIIEEIVHNWKEHSDGSNKLKVTDNSLVFSNDLKNPLDLKRPKAQLRCPFMQKNTGKGHGLGLYMLSIASSKGDFDWNIETDGNCFTLSLFFA